MSIYAVDWAFKQSAGASAMKFLLVAMANYADEEGYCYPSVWRLTQDTEQNRKTILKNISKLEKLNLVLDTGERKGPTRSVPVYRLLMASGPKNGTPEQSQNRDTIAVPILTPSGPNLGRKRSQKRDTDPSGTVSEPSKGGASASHRPKNKDGSEVYLLNQALEIAPASAKKELLKKKREVLGNHFAVDLSHKPPAQTHQSESPPQPPANPSLVEKLIAEAKQTVESVVPVKPNLTVLRQLRAKRPPPLPPQNPHPV